MENVTVFDHPLTQHRISILRDKRTGTNGFRTLIEEIAVLTGYEALRDLPLMNVEAKTPIEKCSAPMTAGKKPTVVSILRAGFGAVNGILALVPSAKVGHIDLYRGKTTHEPHKYHRKLSDPIEQKTIVVIDPMLAIGGSGVAAADFIKTRGGRNIRFMLVTATPEGLERLHNVHPDIQIYVEYLDRCLNENAYICPGLGSVGDRIFGTRQNGTYGKHRMYESHKEWEVSHIRRLPIFIDILDFESQAS